MRGKYYLYDRKCRYDFGVGHEAGDEFVLVSFNDSEETFNTKLKRLKKHWKDDFSAAIGSVWVESTKELEKNISIADKK